MRGVPFWVYYHDGLRSTSLQSISISNLGYCSMGILGKSYSNQNFRCRDQWIRQTTWTSQYRFSCSMNVFVGTSRFLHTVYKWEDNASTVYLNIKVNVMYQLMGFYWQPLQWIKENIKAYIWFEGASPEASLRALDVTCEPYMRAESGLLVYGQLLSTRD